MNRQLRQRHRRMTTLLAVVAPAVFIAALVARPPEPVEARLPGIDPSPELALVGERNARIGELDIRIRRYRTNGAPQRALIEIDPVNAPRDADVLVYWHGAAEPVTTLPAGARLLGSLAGDAPRRLMLPAGAERGGALLFYALAAQRLLGPPVAIDAVGDGR